MKKIVPFKKDLPFKTNLSEITSISLEHSLHLSENNTITGSFDLNGEYKVADSSTSCEKFSFEMPFDINIDDKYLVDKVTVDIDDFYYEIIDNKVLSINIEVLIDGLEEKPLFVKVEPEKEVTLDDLLREEEEEKEEEEKRCYDEEDAFPFKEIETPIVDVSVQEEKKKMDKVDNVKTEDIKSLFDNIDDASETYATYKVCILRENETVEGIMQKYSVSKDILELYNNLNELKIGDKIIIPSLTNEKI